MSFKLGKSDLETITGLVSIHEPTDNGDAKHVATLAVTVKSVSRSEFLKLSTDAEDDCQLCRDLVVDIKAGPDQDVEVAPYTPELMDEIFEYHWQFYPILQLVLQINNPQLGRALQVKN